MSSEEVIRKLLEETLKPEILEVSDFSDGCGAKFNVVIVSSLFEGKPLIQRHRLVNEALAGEMPKIHALTMKTYTGAQWKDIKEKEKAAN